MTLAELLQSRFRGDIRFRGAAYVSAERVSIARVTPEQVVGIVRDGVEYETQLNREDGELKMFCNCDSGSQPDAGCKHLWATILAVDGGGYAGGSARPGHIPPFAPDTISTAEFDFTDSELTGDVYHPPRSGRARQEKFGIQPRLQAWEQQLDQLRDEMESGEALTSSLRAEREIYYEIDADESRAVGQLVIHTSQRQRRANGQWGKRKPLKLRSGRLDDVEREDDRTILAYLSGATPERTNWHAQRAELQTRVDRYRVPFELCLLILPMMCATSRVRLYGESDKGLTWEDGPAWELSLQVHSDAATGEWRLQGLLRRGENTLVTEETDLLLPGGLVVYQRRIARLQDFGAFAWFSLLGRSEPISVPPGEEHALIDRLFDMPVLPRMELPDELKLKEVSCEPIPCLTVRSPRATRWKLERLQGDVTFDYLGAQIRGSSQQWAIVQREERRCILRNRQREAAAWSLLQELGFRRLTDRSGKGHDLEVAARDLGPAVRTLIAAGWQVLADGKQVRQPEPIQFRVQSGIDWFELHADVDFEGRSLPFPELLAALVRGDSTVRLDDGSLGILPDDWSQRYGVLAGLGVSEDDHVRFAQNQAALLDALLAARENIDYDQTFAEFRDKLRSFSGISPTQEPKSFIGTLRGYQRDGLGWLSFLQEYGFGGCLADDMGLGKTVQILAMLLVRRKGRKNKRDRCPSLVVVPKSLMFNWHQECNRFTPELKVLEYAGLEREQLRGQFDEHDVLLTTYGTLRRDIMVLKDVQFDYVILDEAQTIKNAGSQTAKASRLLRANHRMALSGTPVENHLGDLWSIFEFLNPGMLGRSSVFKSYTTGFSDESRELLACGLNPFILRRTKKQVASELPDKFEQTICCDMGHRQTQLYEELRDHYRNSLLGLVQQQGLSKSKMHVLEALLRLRQAACHPALLDKAAIDESSAKLDVLQSHLEQLLDEGHKALVFSQFTSMLAIVKHHLDKKEIVYEYLDGQTRDRKERVERFQTDPDCGVFLISLKAGGLGLNLTAADYVYLLDPWWNPAVEAQAIDRAHRVGQSRQVFAYRLICRNTVEEKIAELQNRKRKLAEAILEADRRLLKEMSLDDLEMLLT